MTKKEQDRLEREADRILEEDALFKRVEYKAKKFVKENKKWIDGLIKELGL